MKSHYFNVKMVKMGRWALYPADLETWMTEHTSRYFQELFGIPKGILNIFELDSGFMQNYVPAPYFDVLYSRIREITNDDFKGLEKKLFGFYKMKEAGRKALAEISNTDLSKLTNEELVNVYKKNRDVIHRITIFDQLGWIGENYWNPLMEAILIKKHGLKKDSFEYNETLFALTKPREISTTLEEKRAVFDEAIKVKEGKDMQRAAESLSLRFGWMPVFTYGLPWTADHYLKELRQLTERDMEPLKADLQILERYSALRDAAIDQTVAKYKITPEDLQTFIDFGLVLDTRNEAEYVVSWGGFYLIPIYNEITKRLNITVTQLRMLYEDEVVLCLEGKADPRILLKAKGKMVAYGYDETMTKRINFTEEESKELFEYVEKQQTAKTDSIEIRRGITASIGKAKGKARIIMSHTENNKVQPGDIMITVATAIDFLPAMKNAAAIITEVGGLTCHAAVVCREFGIPCIVSLKNATKEFKDGDLVEVDADKGTVTIIQKA